MKTLSCASCNRPVHARTAAVVGVSQCQCQGIRTQVYVDVPLPEVVDGVEPRRYSIRAAWASITGRAPAAV